MENHLLKKFEYKSTIYRLNIYFSETNIDISLFEDRKAWKINIDAETLKHLSTKYDSNVTEYYNSLKHNIKWAENNEITFENNQLTVFTTTNDLKIKVFDCLLNEVDFSESIFTLCDDLYAEKIKICKENEERQENYNNLLKTKNECTLKLEEFIVRKQNDDIKLCNKFGTMLNEKNEKIQYLKEMIEALENGTTEEISSKKAVKRMKANETDSD